MIDKKWGKNCEKKKGKHAIIVVIKYNLNKFQHFQLLSGSDMLALRYYLLCKT